MISVLYVDDEEVLLDITKMYLERTGEISVDTTTSALLALKKISQANYDVIVSDYQMPDMDGIAFLKKLRSDNNGIPFIIFTGRGREEVVIEALNNGADFYLQKGGEPKSQFAELQSKIQQATLRKRAERDLAKRNDELNVANAQLAATTAELRQKYNELSCKETELKESGKRYRSMIENIQAAVVLLNPDTSIRMINNLALELLGITPEEATGRLASHPTWHFSREDGSILPLADYPVNRVLATRKPLHKLILGIFRQRRGDTVWVLVDADPEFDENGILTAVLITFTDITDRRQTEEKQRVRERFLTTLISNLPGFAYRCNNDPAWTMEYMSEGCRKITGYAPEDFLGNKTLAYNDIIHPDFRKHLWDTWQDQLRKKETFEDEYPIITKTGETRWVWERGRGIFNANGELVHLEGYITDISTRKYAEESFQQANRKLNLLSGITRHDIMNQLLALEGYLELSKKTLDNPALTSEFIEKVEKVAQNISHQIGFTRDYEDLGVKSSSWQNVYQIMKKITPRLPVRNVRIDAGDPDLEIFADPLLENVFFNLADNALRYGGEKMTHISVTNHKDNGNLQILVEDDGNGISDEDKKQLFIRGYGKNSGLGLYLSREILAITGITITETGELGKGARFEIAVPNGGYRIVR
jgi:PAS domain S-box-containing protein